MIPVSCFAYEKVAILGLGKTGLSAAKALALGKAQVLAWDDAPERRQEAFLEQIPLADLTGIDWSDVKALLLSPGIPHHLPRPHPIAQKAIEAGVPVLCDIDLLCRTCPEADVICVTGSNGKSTTTALIGHILKSVKPETQIGGNIGEAALTLNPLEAGDAYVLELSSYQLERVPSLSATTAVFLNISPDHIDRHGSLEGYVATKKRIFASSRLQNAIIGVDDPQSRDVYEELKEDPQCTVVPVSSQRLLEKGVYYKEGKLYDSYWQDHACVLDLTHHMSLQGGHNGQNAAAAYTACRLQGLKPDQICFAAASFEGLPHRMEYLGFCEGVRFVNDSKATNADAAAKALACFDEIYWIAGGRSKEGGLQGLQTYYGKIRHAYLIGEAADLFEAQLKGKIASTRCDTLEKATLLAFREALKENHANSVVLLSPACASLDQFKNFEQRGEMFREIYHALLKKTATLLTGTVL